MDKDKKKAVGPDRMIEVLVLVLMVFFIWLVISRIQQLLAFYTGDTFSMIWSAVVDYFLTYLWPIIKILSVVVGVLCLVGIYYNSKKLKEIEKTEETTFGKPETLSGEAELEVKNLRWENIQRLINSTNESDWRQAILEADIMLDELLTASGHHEGSIGDKLQSVEPSDFLSLQSAWDAHKIRNRIAHDGASFQLNDREAKGTIAQYEAVFKEFKVI